MTVTVTIRKVPEPVRNVLAARAARSGQSLQEYLLAALDQLAARPSVDELVAEVRERKARSDSHVDADTILAARDSDRR